jgi:hypothetical protein
MEFHEHLLKHAERLQARVEAMQHALALLYADVRSLGDILRSHSGQASTKDALPVASAAGAVPGAAKMAAPVGAIPASAVPAVAVASPAVAATPAAHSIERRALPRQQANQVLIELASVMDESRTFNGWVIDYSAAGLGLWVQHRMPVGTYLMVRPARSTSDTKWREAEVKNCNRHQEGYRLGCKIDGELTTEEFKRFGLE